MVIFLHIPAVSPLIWMDSDGFSPLLPWPGDWRRRIRRVKAAWASPSSWPWRVTWKMASGKKRVARRVSWENCDMIRFNDTYNCYILYHIIISYNVNNVRFWKYEDRNAWQNDNCWGYAGVLVIFCGDWTPHRARSSKHWISCRSLVHKSKAFGRSLWRMCLWQVYWTIKHY